MAETPAAAPASSKKRIALFLDGTWNTVRDNTNVWRLKALCKSTSGDGSPQRVFYSTGLGTLPGERALGGVSGYGLDRAVTEAYEWLIETHRDQDEIFIFGFSRGAYTARSLAGLISKYGLLSPGAPLGVKQLYARYQQGDKPKTIADLTGHTDAQTGEPELTLEEKWMKQYCQTVPIKFIGVFDTVGALGVPHTNLFRSWYQFLDPNLRTSYEYAFQALAIDENREDFAPTLWKKYTRVNPPDPTTSPPRTLEHVEQRWFVGAHANVGGGCFSDLLAQIPLRWMMEKAAARGLTFRTEIAVEDNAWTSPISDSFSEFLYGAYRLWERGRRFYREIGYTPERVGDYTVNTVNETIDATVFNRWRQVPGYRPPSLDRWAKKYGVNPGDLNTAVRADDPKVSIAE